MYKVTDYQILQRSSLLHRQKQILDDFTTPLRPIYLAPTPSIPILLTKNTHDFFVTPSRVQTTTVIQKSHKPVVWLTDEITGRGQGCRSFFFFFSLLLFFSLSRSSLNCFRTKSPGNEETPPSLPPQPLTQMRFARFRNINCAPPVKRMPARALLSLSSSLFGRELSPARGVLRYLRLCNLIK